MSVRVALVLGLCAIVAAMVHGGIWTPGHDFVVNRFTGEFVFVPSGDEPEEDTHLPAHAALTTSGADDRFHPSLRRR